MSRWKSPQTAALLARKVAKENESRRKEKFRSRVYIVLIAIGSLSLLFADYAWLRYTARERHELKHKRLHGTNVVFTNTQQNGNP